MSYQLTIWEGARPDESRPPADDQPPTAAIAAYVRDLLAHWPDGQPLVAEASGPVVHLVIRSDRATDVADYAVHLAEDRGLGSHDPQRELLASIEGDPDAAGPPRTVRDWLSWLRRTIFGS